MSIFNRYKDKLKRSFFFRINESLFVKKNQHLTDVEIINFVKNGDKKYFEIIVHRYCEKIFNYAFRLAEDKDIAESLTNDTFAKASNRIKTYKDDYEKASAWIYTICYNTFIDHLKKMKNEGYKESIEEYKNISEDNSTKDDAIKDSIIDACEKMTYRQKKIFEYCSEKTPHRQIAEELSVSRRTVSRDIKIFKEILKESLNNNGIHFLLLFYLTINRHFGL